MSPRIKKVSIRACRGITELDFPLDNRSLCLKGENGTGKSALVDALEFFFTGGVDHLEGIRGLSLRNHLPHVDYRPQDVKVAITFNDGTTLVRSFDRSPDPSGGLEPYFDVTTKGTFILRRAQVLAFITNQPADRFRAIGSIMGIESLDKVELEMMRLRDKLKGEVETHHKTITDLLQEIAAATEIQVEKRETIVLALNDRLQKLDSPPITSLEDAEQYKEKLLISMKGKADSSSKAKLLKDISDLTESAKIQDEMVAELEALNKKIEKLLQQEAKAKLSLINLLKTGMEVVQASEEDTCPLCEQPIDKDALIHSLNERLTVLSALSAEASEIRTTSVPIEHIITQKANWLSDIRRKLQSVQELSTKRNEIQSQEEFWRAFIDKVSSATKLEIAIPLQDVIEKQGVLNNLLTDINTACLRLFEHIELTPEEKRVLEAISLIEKIKNKSDDINTCQGKLVNSEKYYGQAQAIYMAYSDCKKERIQHVYNAIQGDIRRFYSELHADEPHRNVELIVDLGKRASTDLKIESFGRTDQDPRALTSEGHLDSLGLCIFLAFVKEFNKDCSLIVLDDVVTTIDSKHRAKVAELLLEEFDNKQLIVTTHDEIWFRQLTEKQRASRVEGSFNNLEIVSWDRDTGPNIRPYLSRWGIIEKNLREGNRKGAASEGRTYLEWVLEEICEGMQAQVVYKRKAKHFIPELLDPAEKRIEQKLEACPQKDNLLSAFKGLRKTMSVGNWLSHHNWFNENVSTVEVRYFVEAVRAFHKAFQCSDCGRFLRYSRDSERFGCLKPSCRLKGWVGVMK